MQMEKVDHKTEEQKEETTDFIEIDMKEVNESLLKNKMPFDKGTNHIKFNLKKGETEDKLDANNMYLANISNGKFTYTGALSEKLERNGFGRNEYVNGDVYLGSWEKNKRYAQGVYLHKPDNDQLDIYSGFWEDGVKNRAGAYVWKKGTTFDVPSEDVTLDAYCGKFWNGLYSEGLYVSQKVEEKKLSYYIYLGHFNSQGKKDDQRGIYYIMHSHKLFFGRILDNELISGYVMKEKDMNVEGLFFFEKNENGEVKTRDVTDESEKNEIEESANTFLQSLEHDYIAEFYAMAKTAIEEVGKFKQLDRFENEETFAKDFHDVCGYSKIYSQVRPLLDLIVPKEEKAKLTDDPFASQN
jgi:hypothetical protein